jgi:hypothetical protein
MTRPRMTRRSLGALALIASLVLAGCSAGRGSSGSVAASASAAASASPHASASASPHASASASAAASEPTGSLPPFACSPSVTISATTERAQITGVRVGTHEGYDRVVFEFASGIPSTVIEGVLPPLYADPSGMQLAVGGTAYLKVTMHGASTISPDGVATYSGSTNFKPGFSQLVQLLEGGDFEAVSTWYLGLNGGGCIRVLTLADPSRLVIDVQH